ncbi:uroporphyrinogen-III C-methyltransferase [Aeromonas cavernicola]|uniref:Heme biosynthesis operon protein HemX n=1 Tax=Aeromonas cavernicola TaxID=1006623 RepID=A0A2H9U3S2_9GAMM|nr:uroporphyrinogen-III C-methyltransferase [Aeromonas cavernicola]PJG58619.1 heme biosynthesis operon protein HemX [Aeromonas cavernicola]
MTEQPETVVTPTPTATTSGSRPHRSGAVLGAVAILLALGLTGGLYLHGHKNAVTQQAELAQLKLQLNSIMTQVEQKESRNSNQLTTLTDTQQRLNGEMQELQSQVLDLNHKRPNDWMLAESEYLVRMAGRKLWLEHDLLSAITLLGNADERIKTLNDPSLMPIRQALAEDITQLKGLPRVDREGLTLKLAALEDQIDQLPLSAVNMPDAKIAPEQTVSSDPTDWQTNLKTNWVKFTENFITIRRRDSAVEALLSPQQEIFLRENLKTKLLQAQVAIYREQQGLYEDSIAKAQRWLNQYFVVDNSATHYMQGELDKLKGEQIQFDYPDQFKTQAMLEQVVSERLQRILTGN